MKNVLNETTVTTYTYDLVGKEGDMTKLNVKTVVYTPSKDVVVGQEVDGPVV